METLNSYYSRAVSDLRYAEAGMEVGKQFSDFNNVAALCAQSAGNFLKAIIESGFQPEDDCIRLLKTHNLRSLYNKIITKFKLTVSSKDCKWLGDFYFDARYPGDNFVVVNEDDALECLNIVKNIQSDTDMILAEIQEERSAEKNTLKQLKFFE